MPIKLIPPKAGRTPNYFMRGTHQGVYVGRSTGFRDKSKAARKLAQVIEAIEADSIKAKPKATFASAAMTYMQLGGERRFVDPLLAHFGEGPISAIDQVAIDAAAQALYPQASNATRNRQVYSPMSAILKRAGVAEKFKRPIGSRGKSRLAWLSPEEVEKLIDAAGDNKFGALLTFLTYTGTRLGEALSLRPEDLRLAESFTFIADTKNGDPRPIHLPTIVIEALARLDLTGKTVFRMVKCGRLYTRLLNTARKAGVAIPPRVKFHIFRHTYGAWMRRYGGLDTSGLVATGAWKSRQAAAVYEHADVSEEARKSDLLPTRSKPARRVR
jgi:integrase